MSIPYNNETRESYTRSQAAEHLHWAEVHHKLGNARSMWLQLFYYAMVEDIYGTHWDKLNA
jgi:hypothetical protein